MADNSGSDIERRTGIPAALPYMPNYLTALTTLKVIPYVLLLAYSIFFFAMDIAFANNRDVNTPIPEHTYRTLHAMQFPQVVDLSIVAFLTPALPARLASTWEIQDMLGMNKNRYVTASSLIYPTIDKTDLMDQYLLSRHGFVPGVSCPACSVQDSFEVKNTLLFDQTQYYCPASTESEDMWLSRTRQNKTESISQKYKHYIHFKFNSEHATLCLANRVPTMVLAHVATNIYTLFASQNTVVLLLYIANLNALFACIILLYKWYGASVGDSTFDQITTRNLHGWFSVLFCLLPPLVAIPIAVDYFVRTDNLADSHSGNRAVGSYILGLWTIFFSFVYVSVLPAFSVKLKPIDDKIAKYDTTNAITLQKQGVMDTNHRHALEALAAQQPVITFAYWNLLQAPCFVMLALATQTYGIDIYMQFILFGTIATCVLDILHARIMIILRVMHKLVGEKFDSMHYFFVFGTFLAMHVIVVLGIYAKISQEKMSDAAIAIVALILSTQVVQNLVFLLLQTWQHWNYFSAPEENKPYESMLFNIGLVWHMAVTGVVFFLALGANGTAS